MKFLKTSLILFFIGLIGYFLFILTLPSYIEPDKISKSLQLEQERLLINVENSPDDLYVRFELAMNYAYTGNIVLAESHLAKIQRHSKTDMDYNKTIIQTYAALCKKEPANWTHYVKLSFGYFLTNDFYTGIELLEKAQMLAPQNPWVMSLLSIAYGVVGFYPEAVVQIDRSLKSVPMHPELNMIHTFLMFKSHRYLSGIGSLYRTLQVRKVNASH